MFNNIKKTIEKIQKVQNSNFDKKDMDSLWMSYISDDRNFNDVINAIYEHIKNNDNIKLLKKLEKTAKALDLSIPTLTPFLLKYLLVWNAENEAFSEHLKKLCKLSHEGKLEEKTNIKEVAQGKAKAVDKNRFSLNDEKKILIDSRLSWIDFIIEIDYIKLFEEIKTNLKDENTTSSSDFNSFLNHIEKSIEEYDEELMHTIDGEKKYVFENDEIVGKSTIKFNDRAKKVIDKNSYIFNIFVNSLELKFRNIITEFNDGILKYRLLGERTK